MELETVWDGNTKTPHRGLLCSPEAEHETLPASAVSAKPTVVWGSNAHLLDGQTEVKRPKPQGTRARKRLPVDAVRTLLQTRAYTIVEMMAELNATEWQIRNSFRTIGTCWILSRTCEAVGGVRPPSQFWMNR